MNRGIQSTLVVLRVVSDIFALIFAWIIAYIIRFHSFVPVPKGVPEWQMYLKLIPFICAISIFVFLSSGLYKRQHRSAFIEGLDVLQNSLFATLAIVAFSFFYSEYRYSRVMLVFFLVTQPIFVISGRSIIRKIIRKYRNKVPARNVLIICSRDTLDRAKQTSLFEKQDFKSNKIAGIVLIEDELKQDYSEKLPSDHIYQEVPNDWISFLSANKIESVVICLPHKYYSFIDTHMLKIADQVSDIRLIPDLAKYTKFAAGVDLINGVPVVSIHESPLSGIGVILKRGLDIIGSIFALLLFGPIMVAIAILVPLTSRGPILYKQVRMGLDGKTFEIFKFRSMPVDAEKKTGAIWATAGDNRPTKLGSFLRRTSLDELPQFLNVLKGDMSLVGPRPERPVFVEKFRRDVPGYMLRHKTKAGITGWAQINGWRGDTSIDKRIECDLYYIQNWSLWFDIKILLLTPVKGFVSKNAY